MLVCDIFELCNYLFFFVFMCSSSEGLDTPDHRSDYPDFLTGVSGILPGVSRSCSRTLFFLSEYHAICITLVFALTCSPHCKIYKSFCGSLDIYAKIVDMSSLKFKSSWHTLRGSSYMLDVYCFMIIKWATCGLSSITKKGEIESDLGP